MIAPPLSIAKDRRRSQRGGRPSPSSGAVSLAELLEGITISELAVAVGGGPIRRGRCRAWYRDGWSSTSLAIDDSRGCWYDHGTQRGGGKLDLIQTALDCDRRAARDWLAAHQGVELLRSSRQGRRGFAVRRAAAERRAADLTRWRAARLNELRDVRNAKWVAYHMAETWRLRNQGQRPTDWRWSASLCFIHDLDIGDAYAKELERVARMSPQDLAAEREGQGVRLD